MTNTNKAAMKEVAWTDNELDIAYKFFSQNNNQDNLEKSLEKVNDIRKIRNDILNIETFQLEKDDSKNYHSLHRKDIHKAILSAYEAGENQSLGNLSDTDLKDYGQRLSGVLEDINFMQNAFDLVPNPKTLSEDEIILYFNSTFKLLVSSMDKLTGVMDELDELSCLLLDN